MFLNSRFLISLPVSQQTAVSKFSHLLSRENSQLCYCDGVKSLNGGCCRKRKDNLKISSCLVGGGGGGMALHGRCGCTAGVHSSKMMLSVSVYIS